MNLKEFKDEFRLICSDAWGEAVDCWFEVAGHLYNRGLNIPDDWGYRPGLGDPTTGDNYFYGLFNDCTDEELRIIGNFLFRYCQMLKHYGKDY
jgi:hypothetical protein